MAHLKQRDDAREVWDEAVIRRDALKKAHEQREARTNAIGRGGHDIRAMFGAPPVRAAPSEARAPCDAHIQEVDDDDADADANAADDDADADVGAAVGADADAD
eukprot:1061692-Prymnesium_polylepis.1